MEPKQFLSREEILKALEAILFEGDGLLINEKIEIYPSRDGKQNEIIVTTRKKTIFDLTKAKNRSIIGKN